MKSSGNPPNCILYETTIHAEGFGTKYVWGYRKFIIFLAIMAFSTLQFENLRNPTKLVYTKK